MAERENLRKGCRGREEALGRDHTRASTSPSQRGLTTPQRPTPTLTFSPSPRYTSRTIADTISNLDHSLPKNFGHNASLT